MRWPGLKPIAKVPFGQFSEGDERPGEVDDALLYSAASLAGRRHGGTA